MINDVALDASTPSAEDLAAHFAYLLSGARRLTRNDAEAHDLVQDTFVRALEHLSESPPPFQNLRGWLAVVMRNQWIGTIRHRRVRREALSAMCLQPEYDWSLSETRASNTQLLRAWEQLPSQAQSIATQCLLDGEPYDVVSDRFGITSTTVATTIHRMRERLKITMFGEASGAVEEGAASAA